MPISTIRRSTNRRLAGIFYVLSGACPWWNAHCVAAEAPDVAMQLSTVHQWMDTWKLPDVAKLPLAELIPSTTEDLPKPPSTLMALIVAESPESIEILTTDFYRMTLRPDEFRLQGDRRYRLLDAEEQLTKVIEGVRNEPVRRHFKVLTSFAPETDNIVDDLPPRFALCWLGYICRKRGFDDLVTTVENRLGKLEPEGFFVHREDDLKVDMAGCLQMVVRYRALRSLQLRAISRPRIIADLKFALEHTTPHGDCDTLRGMIAKLEQTERNKLSAQEEIALRTLQESFRKGNREFTHRDVELLVRSLRDSNLCDIQVPESPRNLLIAAGEQANEALIRHVNNSDVTRSIEMLPLGVGPVELTVGELCFVILEEINGAFPFALRSADSPEELTELQDTLRRWAQDRP